MLCWLGLGGGGGFRISQRIRDRDDHDHEEDDHGNDDDGLIFLEWPITGILELETIEQNSFFMVHRRWGIQVYYVWDVVNSQHPNFGF